MTMTAALSRAARGLLDWSQTELGSRANLSESTIRDFEKGRRVPSPNNLAAIQSALEAAGVIFVQENGDGPGVRLRKTGAAGRAHALEHAEAAADRQLAKVEAPAEEKARRKRIVPQLAKKMQSKS